MPVSVYFVRLLMSLLLGTFNYGTPVNVYFGTPFNVIGYA